MASRRRELRYCRAIATFWAFLVAVNGASAIASAADGRWVMFGIGCCTVLLIAAVYAGLLGPHMTSLRRRIQDDQILGRARRIAELEKELGIR